MNLNQFLKLAAPKRFGDLPELEPVNHTSVCLAREVLLNSSTPKPCRCMGVDYEPSVEMVLNSMRGEYLRSRAKSPALVRLKLHAISEELDRLRVESLCKDEFWIYHRLKGLNTEALVELRKLGGDGED